VALFHFYEVGNYARHSPIFIFAELEFHAVGLLLGLDGGSTDIDCCNGEECSEKVSRK